MLEIRNLDAWYGESHVLHALNMQVPEGRVVSLLGRNGAGKSTTMKSIMGLMDRTRGEILYRGANLLALRPDRVARLGVALCPEDRGIFPSLSVQENLMLPPVIAPGGMTLDQIFTLFPNILERRNSRGTQLSGGEQQMLAIARILRTGAKFLLLDEPTEGLAPVIVQQIGRTLSQLKSQGFTIVLVEQNFRFAASVADRHYVVEQGRVIDTIPNEDLAANMNKLHAYLGV